MVAAADVSGGISGLDFLGVLKLSICRSGFPRLQGVHLIESEGQIWTPVDQNQMESVEESDFHLSSAKLAMTMERKRECGLQRDDMIPGSHPTEPRSLSEELLQSWDFDRVRDSPLKPKLPLAPVCLLLTSRIHATGSWVSCYILM